MKNNVNFQAFLNEMWNYRVLDQVKLFILDNFSNILDFYTHVKQLLQSYFAIFISNFGV